MENTQSNNPLSGFFRQPKVYITLPSGGDFYPPESLDLPENKEIPVMAMTAKDELTMKTPDALLNGQATVDVIKSCVPSIKDPWKMPSIDLDAVLIAIRIATYGETLTIETKVPKIGDEKDFQIDLRQILNKMLSTKFVNETWVNNLLVKIRPLTYREFTDSSMRTFEEQRMFGIVNDQELPDSEKLAKFNESFRKLTNVTIDVLTQSVYSITAGEQEVTNHEHIKEFIENTDKDFFNGVTKHLEEQRDKFKIEPLKATCSKDEIERGAPESFEVPITFDQSNFFG